MPSGEEIAKAYVSIEADLSKVPAGMNQLSATVTSKILELQRKTQAQLARTTLEMKVALNAGNMKDFDRLADAQKRLEATMVKVNTAALNQAAAIRAANAEAGRTPRTPPTPGGGGGGFGGGGGGMSGAMGLLVLSQTIDDMQYGFRAIVNNIPQMGMALGSALGMSAEAAMKFAGIAGIAAVAVNLLITHWDTLMDKMGLGRVYTEAEQMEKLAKATNLAAEAQERLNRYKRTEEVGQTLSHKMASGVEKTEAEVMSVIADMGDTSTTGQSKLIAGLVGARRTQGIGAKMTDIEENQVIAAQSNTQRNSRDPASKKFWEDRENKVRAKIQARLDKEDVEQSQKLVNQAVFDPDRRKEMINLIRGNPGAFPKDAAGKLARIKPAKDNTTLAEEATAKGLDEANRADYEAYQEHRRNEDARLAGAMKNSVGQKYLENGNMSEEDTKSEVKKAMQKAGMAASEIGQALDGTAKKLRKDLDAAVKDRALDRGISEGTARAQLAKEAKDLDDKQAHQPKAEVMSTENYLSKALVAGLDKAANDIPAKQLTEQQTANQTLKDIRAEIKKGQKPGPATFARGRS